jgi:Tol biopolymer transport system component
MMPAWSPDGRWLAWSDFALRTGGIRVMGSDGRVFRTFRPSLDVQVYPTWSGDSRQLAFWDVSRLGGLLKVADIERGTVREVLRRSHPRIEGAWGLEWMPGGRDLLIQTDDSHSATLDTISGNRRDIRKQAVEMGFISPDRRWRAFCEGPTPSPIHVVPLNSDAEPMILQVSAFPSEALLGWWPDGSLLEIRGSTDPSQTSQEELWRRPLNGAPAEPLGVSGTNIIYLSVAPDAKRVAYGTQTFGQELWTLKPVRPH